MEWVPEDMWFTYLQVDAEAGDLDYDLAVVARRAAPCPTLADTGVPAPEVRPVHVAGPGASRCGRWWPVALVAVVVAAVLLGRRRRDADALPA